MLSLKTVLKITCATGIVVGVTGHLLRFKIQNNIRQSQIYKDALQALQNHNEALELIGTPIQEMNLDIGNTESNSFGPKDKKIWITIPVSGPKGEGRLRVEALIKDPESENKEFDIYKLEFKVDNMPNEVVVIKDNSASIQNIDSLNNYIKPKRISLP